MLLNQDVCVNINVGLRSCKIRMNDRHIYNYRVLCYINKQVIERDGKL